MQNLSLFGQLGRYPCHVGRGSMCSSTLIVFPPKVSPPPPPSRFAIYSDLSSPLLYLQALSTLKLSKMEFQNTDSNNIEMMIRMALALAVIGAWTYYYFVNKKPKAILIALICVFIFYLQALSTLKLSKIEFQNTDSTDIEMMIRMALALAVIGAWTYHYFVNKKPKGCLDPENFKEFQLVELELVSRSVTGFRFRLPTRTSVLGLSIGQHIICRGRDLFGEEVVRRYTPLTVDADPGYFDLLIKMYPLGRMSHHFEEMRIGDYLAVKGPKGRFKYQPNEVRAFGMIAGGTGITPMYQVARAILDNPEDKTNIHLIYANDTYNDILLKVGLEDIALKYPSQFSVYYVLDKPPAEWEGGIGYVSAEMIQAHCPAPAPDIKILRCGPRPMNKAIAAHLRVLGYSSQMQFQF